MGFIRRGNYAENTPDEIVEDVKRCLKSKIEGMSFANHSEEESAAVAKMFLCLRSEKEFIIDGKCYVGISANPVQSLSAHGIDIHAENTFFCMDIPIEKAEECRQKLSKLDGFEAVTDIRNDYFDSTYSQMYIYIYRISDTTKEEINISGFTPLKNLPDKPIIIEKNYTAGTFEKTFYDELNKNMCIEFINDIMREINGNKLAKISITHRKLNTLYAEFGEGCCIINYDNGTSQTGGYQSYRSGEKSRKKVKLFTGEYPEYMLCRDMTVLENILTYFLSKGNKPTKRQNVKWVNMRDTYDDDTEED